MDLCNKKELMTLLESHGFTFSKALGQNFLTARWVIDRMVEESFIDKNTGVLEIGPGAGVLTRELCENAGKVVAIELDDRLLNVLDTTLDEYDNVTVIHADALEVDFAAIVKEHFEGLRPVVCANLPYSVTTPVITKLLQSECFDAYTLMVQKEVAERLCAKPGSSQCGAITAFTYFYTEPRLMFKVPAACYNPTPKVDSAVMYLKSHKERAVKPEEQEMFFRTVKAAFAQRRKTLVNSLSSSFLELDKATISSLPAKLGLDERIRGEKLTLEQFADLSRLIGELCK